MVKIYDAQIRMGLDTYAIYRISQFSMTSNMDIFRLARCTYEALEVAAPGPYSTADNREN